MEFRRIGGILEKLDATAELLVSTALDVFLSSGHQRELAEWIQAFAGRELSQGSVKKNIREKLFWPRNQILHFGRTDFTRAQAEGCLKAAIVAMKIYQIMNQHRASRL